MDTRTLFTASLAFVLLACSSSEGTDPVTPLLDDYVLTDPALVPESGSFDPVSRSFYVGSATEGSITEVDAEGAETLFFEPPTDESWRTLGVIVDAQARRLWVCAQQESPAVLQQIWGFDLDAGSRSFALELSEVAEAASCNDIAIDSEGLAYISDSANPRIYRANADAETIEVWADDPILGGGGAGFGGNGIAVTADDAYVLLSKTLALMPPRIARIDRNDPSRIAEVATDVSPTGADGMSFLDGNLYLADVVGGEVLRFTSDDDWASARATATPVAQGTSTVRPAEGDLYAIYSDITASLFDEPLSPPFRIFKVDLDSFE